MSRDNACEHEVDPMPQGVVFDDSPFPRAPTSVEQIVPCKKCGAPVDRGRFMGLIDNPNAAMPWLVADDAG